MALFIALTFVISWVVFLLIPLRGLTYGKGESIVIIMAAIFVPALCSILTRLITKEGFRNLYLQPHFKGHIKHYLLVYFGPTILLFLSGVVYFPGSFDPELSALKEAAARTRGLSAYNLLLIPILGYCFSCLATRGGLKMAGNKSKKLSIPSVMRRAGHIMLIIFSILLAFILIIAGILLTWSPGKPKPFIGENGKVSASSISEKIHVNINGVDQGMFIKSKNKANPVLLFIHGGPGMPEYFLTRSYPTGLEDYFTVCYWEQRGAGLSYSSDIPSETLTEKQLISDTLEVTNYLRKRFGQEKIYLMAHSWGSFIGIQAAARAPEMYNAYIGMAQISRPLESEKLAYKYMMEQYTLAGDKRMVQRLEKFPIIEMDIVPNSYRSLRDEAMHKLGIGTMHNMESVVSGIFWPSWKCPEYTLSEKVNIWRGKWSPHSTNMWNQMIATDLNAKVPKLDVPVYFFHGIYDYTCSYTLAKDYFEKLQAPLKEFYTFEQSAHSPLFEEPEKMQHILQRDVLLGVNKLADAK